MEKRNTKRVLLGKSDIRRPPARPISGWENNFKTDLERV
jgi:hypothetical protein